MREKQKQVEMVLETRSLLLNYSSAIAGGEISLTNLILVCSGLLMLSLSSGIFSFSGNCSAQVLQDHKNPHFNS